MRRIVIALAVFAAFSGEILGQDDPPSTINLMSPVNGATNVLMDEDFIWNSDTSAVTYEIEIATNPGFSNVVVNAELSDTVFTLEGELENDTEYFWRVRGSNDNGDGDWSDEWSFTTIIEEPEAVTLSDPADGSENLSITPTLSWNSAERAESYQLELSANAGFTEVVTDTQISGTDFNVDEELSNNTTYYWRVKAQNDGGESDWSDEWSFTTIVEEPGVVSLSEPADGSDNISTTPELIWNSSENAETYQLQLSSNSDFSENEVDTQLAGTEYTVDEALPNGSTFYWRVQAQNEAGESDWSEEWSFTTIVSEPNTVTLESPENNSTGVELSPELAWQALDGAESYDLQVATDAGFDEVVINNSGIESTNFTPENPLENDTQYFWRVRGENDGGEGPWSETWNFTTIIEQPASVSLSEPANNADGISTTPTLSWNEAARAETYQLELSANSDFTELITQTEVAATEFAVDETLANGSVFYWRVKAENEGGESDWSEVWNFTTVVSEPNVVELESPRNGTDNVELTPLFEWQAAGGAENYTFQLATDSDFNNLVINDSEIETTSFTPGFSLDNDTRYYWRVRAENAGGSGSWSQTWNFRTIIEQPEVTQLSEPANNADNISTFPTLRWNSAERAENYEVELSSNSDFSSTIIDTLLSDRTELSVGEGLDNESTYYWRVKAHNDGGESDWSDVWNFTTIVSEPNTVALASPSNGSTGLTRSPEFEWQVLDGAVSYEIQVATDSGFNDLMFEESGIESTTITQDDPLDYGTQYFWRVRGENEGGDGPWSQTWNFTTIVEQPGVAQLSEPGNNSNDISTFPTLVWHRAERAGEYQFELSANADFSETIVDSVLSDTTFSMGDRLPRNSTFYWRVKTLNEGGESDWSEIWNFTTIPDSPAIVELLEPDNNADGVSVFPVLKWSSVVLAEEYLVEVATDNIFENLVFDSLFAAPDTSFEFDDELDGNTEYYWSVKAYNSGGSSDWSEVYSFTTMGGTSTEEESMPVEFTLNQNYPNPFNPTTTIRYGIPEASEVRLEVFNTLGQKVSTLVNERKSAGWHTVNFDASQLASGMYIYRIKAKDFVSTKKLMLIK